LSTLYRKWNNFFGFVNERKVADWLFSNVDGNILDIDDSEDEQLRQAIELSLQGMHVSDEMNNDSQKKTPSSDTKEEKSKKEGPKTTTNEPKKDKESRKHKDKDNKKQKRKSDQKTEHSKDKTERETKKDKNK
jgi:outer membrane biosynthesis protein TonB